MISVASAEKVLPSRYDPYGLGNFRTPFIGVDRHKLTGAPDRTSLAPVAYMIEQGPHQQLRPHFHIADQFQIFVSGEGRIGGHRATPGIGHFAGPYTAYGPIVGGESGVGYMTLRNAWDDGAQFLPDKMDDLRPRRHERREILMTAAPPASADELTALREPTCTSLVSEQADGLGAWSHRLPPRGSVTGPAPATGGGQFWLVMSGAMASQEEGLLARLSLAFVSPDEPPFVAESGPDGLHVLAMQFPVFRRQ
jgi:hypothetical protein